MQILNADPPYKDCMGDHKIAVKCEDRKIYDNMIRKCINNLINYINSA